MSRSDPEERICKLESSFREQKNVVEQHKELKDMKETEGSRDMEDSEKF